jgi:hypothetical protein
VLLLWGLFGLLGEFFVEFADVDVLAFDALHGLLVFSPALLEFALDGLQFA